MTYLESKSDAELRQLIREAEETIESLCHCENPGAEIDTCSNNIARYERELARRKR